MRRVRSLEFKVWGLGLNAVHETRDARQLDEPFINCDHLLKVRRIAKGAILWVT